MTNALKLLLPLLAATALACESSVAPPTPDGGGTSGGATSGGGTTGGGTGSGGSTGGLGQGSACVAPQPGGKDPCAATGYYCTPASSGGAAGTCQLPGTEDPCEPVVGCVAGDACLQVSQNPVAYGCFQGCTTTTDCTIISSSCQTSGTQKVCNANTCGPGLPSGFPSSGPAFYAPCNAAGTNDGFCLPYDYSGLGTIGLCFAGSPADAGAPSSCGLERVAGGTLCPLGTFCLPDTATGNSACMPVCESGGPDAGPACAGGFCLGVIGGPYFGFCLASCTSSATCATGQSCLTVPGVADGGTVCAP